MQLRELRVRRLPGIDTPFTLRAAPGVNVIAGPNGSGKSSLCRAVRALLWPDREAYEPLDVVARWDVQGETWRASRQGRGKVRWQRAGVPAGAPTMPGDQVARAYRLESVDLLKSAPGATDRELAEEIRTRMAGGYNLDKVVRDHYGDQPRLGQKQQRERIAAVKRVRRLRGQQQELAGEEQELQTVRQHLDAGRRAAGRLPYWLKSRDLAAVAKQYAEVAARCDAFPPVLKDMDGSEPQQLAEFAEQRRRKRDDLIEPQARIADAERRLAASELPDGPPDAESLDLWQERVRVCGDLQQELRQAEQELAAQRARLASVGENLLAEWSGAAAPAIGAETVAAVEAYLASVRPLRARSDALTELVADVNLAPAQLAASPTAIAQGTQLLLDWQTAVTPRSRRGRYAAAVGVVVLAGAALTASLGLALTSLWWLGAAAGGGLAILLTWIASAAWGHARAAARRRDYAARYREIGLPEPPTWTAGGVRQALAQLQRDAAAHALEDEKAVLRRRLAHELTDLAGRASQLDASGRELTRRCGLAPDVADATLVEFSRRVAAYHAARQEHDGAVGRVDALRHRLSAELARVDTFLDGYGAVPTAARERRAAAADGDDAVSAALAADRAFANERDVAAAAAGLRGLARRGDDYRRAADSLAADRAYLRQAAAELEELDRKQAAIYARLSLTSGDEAQVVQLAQQLATYRELARERERLWRDRTRLTDEAARLYAAVEPAADGQPVPPAAHLSLDQLDDRIARDTELAGHVDRLRERIARIDERVQQARGSAALAEALAERTAATERLAESRAAAIEAALGRSLLAAVRDEHEEASRPPLLEQTGALLRMFTHDSYELSVVTGADGALFRVTETTSGRGLTLEQLSAGTRSQLLLAARLAYLLAAESEEALPLFLDESLAAADPVRFAAVVAGLAATVAADGRQVFYLTSDPADVARWQAALSEAGQPEPTIIDLAALRGMAAAADPAELILPAAPTVPPSAGREAADYGRQLGVPRLDPFAATDAIHLFYLLRDRLDLLEVLLRRRIERLGQWRLGTPERRRGLAPEDVTLLDVRAEVAAAFFAAWRIGRGRPVDRAALVDSGAVSPRFLEEVAALSQALGGDARALLDGLAAGRVKGFRREKAGTLESFLLAHGYCDRRAALDREGLLEQVGQAVAQRLERGEITADAVVALVAALSATVAGPSAA